MSDRVFLDKREKYYDGTVELVAAPSYYCGEDRPDLILRWEAFGGGTIDITFNRAETAELSAKLAQWLHETDPDKTAVRCAACGRVASWLYDDVNQRAVAPGEAGIGARGFCMYHGPNTPDTRSTTDG